MKTTEEKKDMVVILVGNKFPTSFMVQTADNHRRRLLALDDQGNRTRPIRYLANYTSIFVDEQPVKDGEVLFREPIVIEDGQLIIPKTKGNLQAFIKAHPDYDLKFTEFDKSKEVEQHNEEMDLEWEAESFVRTHLSPEGDFGVVKQMVALIREKDVERMNSAEIKHEALQLARMEPDRVIDFSKGPRLAMSVTAREAFSSGIVTSKNYGKDIKYDLPDNKDFICSVPKGVTKEKALENFFVTTEGTGVYADIKAKLETE